MKLRRLVCQERYRIDREVRVRKKELEYIAKLAEENYSILVELVNSETSEEEKAGMVYGLVKKAIEEMENIYTIYDSIIWDKMVKEGLKKNVSFLLGWTEIRYNEERPVPFGYYPSELGEKIYNELRIINGKKQVHEKIKFFKSVLKVK